MDYKKPRHAETLIEAFYTYKQHELFCDATLVVDEEQLGTKFLNDTARFAVLRTLLLAS